MKLLHTADWHVGKTLAGRLRAGEHRAVLSEITALAEAESVDAVLVAGDLFDTASPSPGAEEIVYETLLGLARVAPVLVVPGNHDSEHRLEALSPLLKLANVTVRAFARPEPVELDTAAGEKLRVGAIPWLSQRHIVKAADLMSLDAAEMTGDYRARMAAIVSSIAASFEPDAVNVMLGHLTIAGGEMGGGERTAQTIFDYWVDATIFPSSAHYVALGHLHKAQKMAGPCPVHYCGSPMMLDFSDGEDTRQTLIVEAAPSTPAKVRSVPVAAGRKLRTIKGTLDELRGLQGKTGDDFLRVRVTEPARVGLGDEVREMFPETVKVIVEHESLPIGEVGRADRAAQTPHDLFTEYLASKNIADDRLVALFDELHEEVHASSST